jgi:hypothetical protein
MPPSGVGFALRSGEPRRVADEMVIGQAQADG